MAFHGPRNLVKKVLCLVGPVGGNGPVSCPGLLFKRSRVVWTQSPGQCLAPVSGSGAEHQPVCVSTTSHLEWLPFFAVAVRDSPQEAG